MYALASSVCNEKEVYMGLDMYLFRRKKGSAELPEHEQIYWRKANQIRRWIVDHAGYPPQANCEPFVLTKDVLNRLIDDSIRVLVDHDIAVDVMPTSDGFFFGNTDIFEWYFQQLAETVRDVSALIAGTNFDEEEIVYYEWY